MGSQGLDGRMRQVFGDSTTELAHAAQSLSGNLGFFAQSEDMISSLDFEPALKGRLRETRDGYSEGIAQDAARIRRQVLEDFADFCDARGTRVPAREITAFIERDGGEPQNERRPYDYELDGEGSV